jgi:hypothetical protein
MKHGRYEYLETMVGKPPEGWTLDTTLLREGPDVILCEVECWLRSGLAVHEFVVGERRLGRITHKRTGFRIVDCASLDDAAMAAEMIEDVAKWSEIKSLADAASDKTRWPTIKRRIESVFVPDRTIVAHLEVYRPVA